MTITTSATSFLAKNGKIVIRDSAFVRYEPLEKRICCCPTTPPPKYYCVETTTTTPGPIYYCIEPTTTTPPQ